MHRAPPCGYQGDLCSGNPDTEISIQELSTHGQTPDLHDERLKEERGSCVQHKKDATSRSPRMDDARDPAVSSATDEVVQVNSSEGSLGLERTDEWADTASKTAVRGGESSKSLERASTALKELYEIHDTFFSSDKGEKKVRENGSHLLLEWPNDIELKILHPSQHKKWIQYRVPLSS